MKDKHQKWFGRAGCLIMALLIGGYLGFCIMTPYSPMTDEERSQDAAASYQLDREDYSP